MLKVLTIAGAVFAAAVVGAVEVDGIAAQVGSATILKSEVVAEMMRMGRAAVSFDETLEHMIDVRLILKAAKDAKMTMQEHIIENRLKEIVNRSFGGDRNRLIATLAREKISYPEWRERMKNDMIVGAMRYQMIDRNVVATPALMRREFKEHASRYAKTRKVSVSVILLSPEASRQRMEIDKQLAKRAADFGKLAREYSADSHASENGLWTDVDPEEVFQPQICAAIAALKIGETSEWIEIDGWSFLLRKEAETPGEKRTFTEAYEDIAANVREAEARRLYEEWLKRLRDATYIKIY